MKKNVAELIGTFWFGIRRLRKCCFGSRIPEGESALPGVSLAFGLTVLTIVYSFGIFQGHIEPGRNYRALWAGGRVHAKTIFLPNVISTNSGWNCRCCRSFILATETVQILATLLQMVMANTHQVVTVYWLPWFLNL